MSIATSVGATHLHRNGVPGRTKYLCRIFDGTLLMHSLHIGLVNATPPSERCPNRRDISVAHRSPEKSSASFEFRRPSDRCSGYAYLLKMEPDGFRGIECFGDSTTTFTEQPVRKFGSVSEYAAFARRRRAESFPWAGWCVGAWNGRD